MINRRQKDVLKAWVETGSTKKAAAELNLSTKSIEYHLAQIRNTLGFSELIWLAIWAVKNKIANPPI